MGQIFYVLAILGCGDAGSACQQVRLEQTQYASADACAAATQAQLEASTDLEFPVVTAECRKVPAPTYAALSSR